MTKMYVKIKPGQTVRLRKSPSTNAPILINLPHGTPVEANKYGNTAWHKLTVSYKGRHTGFMMSKYLSTQNPINNNPPPKPPVKKYPIIAMVETKKHGKGGSLNMRKNPSTNSEVLQSIQIGELIQVQKLQGFWLAAKYKGKEGYVLAKYIKNSDAYKKGAAPTPPTPPPVNKYPIATKVDSSKHGTGSSIGLYSAPNENTPEKLSIANGKSIHVARLHELWLPAKYEKEEGYVLAKYIQNSNEYKKQAPPKPPVNPYAISSHVDILKHGAGTMIDLHETPSDSSRVLISIPNAETIQLKTLRGTWLAAKYKNKEGHVLGMYVKNAEQWKEPYPIQAYVDSRKHGTGHAITLYSNPQGYGPELARIDNGKEIWISRRDGTWLAIKYGQHTGFVEAKFIKGSAEYGKNPVQEYPILAKIESKRHGDGSAVDLYKYSNQTDKKEVSIPNGSSIRVKSLVGGLLSVQYKKDGNPQTTYTGFVLARYVQDSEEYKKPSIHNYPISSKIESNKHGTGGAVDLYYYPSDSGKAEIFVPNNTAIRVNYLQEGWYSIYYLTNAHPPRIQVGLVMAKYILNSEEYKKAPANPYLISSKIDSQKHGKGQDVALHEIGGIHGAIRSVIPNGSTIAVKTLQGEWLSCIYSGTNGYVEAKYVKDSIVYNHSQNLNEKYPYTLKVNPLWSKNIGYTKLKNGNYTGPIATSMPRAQGFSTENINIPRGEYLRAASLSGKFISVNYKGQEGQVAAKDLEGTHEQRRLQHSYTEEISIEPNKLSHDGVAVFQPESDDTSSDVHLLKAGTKLKASTLDGNTLKCFYDGDEGYVDAKYIKESKKYREDGYNTAAYINTKPSQEAELKLHSLF